MSVLASNYSSYTGFLVIPCRWMGNISSKEDHWLIEHLHNIIIISSGFLLDFQNFEAQIFFIYREFMSYRHQK